MAGILKSAQAAPDFTGFELATPNRLSPVARLAELHDEAAETALLANLLGRSPYLAVMLAIGAAATAWLVHAPLAPLLTWCVLVGAGLVALTRIYAAAIKQPFERAPLRAFARDMLASMLYLGFAWGAGGFLALTADTGVLEMLAFAAVPIAIVGVLLRASDLTASFALPVALLCAVAPLTKMTASGVLASIAVLAVGLSFPATLYLLERLSTRAPNFAAIPSH